MREKFRLPQKYRTIYWQNFSLSAGIVLLTLTMLGASFFALSYAYAVEERSEDMRNRAAVVADMVETYVSGGSLRDMEELASVAASMTDVDFLICDAGGNVLLTTDASLVNRVLQLPAKVTGQILAGEEYAKRSTLGTIYEKKQFVVGVPIAVAGVRSGIVLAVMDTAALLTMWRAFFAVFMMTAVIVLLLSFAASAWVSMRQTRPIREMAEATRLFADGNFDVRMHDYGAGEIGELAASFNSMAESLKETERQRREFIANVSHELKTPMTTIAGYTDGILDGTIPRENADQYLRIISDESRRLSRLVRRMLEISQLQSGELMREWTPFDVCESMRRVLISMEKKITDRGLDVEADIPDEGVMVMGDNDFITQVIYNLLENAAKFARADSTLYLGLGVANGKAIVSVRNEGETIPAEEIPLLFERFHKSDKSRSADKDGVGLGLYIVKTILAQHKEHIAVSSEDGVTTFAFTLSLAAGGITQG